MDTIPQSTDTTPAHSWARRVRDWIRRHAEAVYVTDRGPCRCGHTFLEHQHYRAGTDCVHVNEPPTWDRRRPKAWTRCQCARYKAAA